jgi:hypothetical protein
MTRNVAFLFIIASCISQPSRGQDADNESARGAIKNAELLKNMGVRKVKNRYTLIAEDEVARLYKKAMVAMDAADQAIMFAGNSADRNQSIIDFQQRIAFDEGLRDQMRVEMKSGTTLEAQTTRRAAERDIAIAKQQRAQMRQAGANPNPREAAKLAANAEAACLTAQKTRQDLVDQVADVDDRYKFLASDSQLRKAMNGVKLEPTDWFKKLAASLGVSTNKRRKSQTPTADQLAARREQAVEELRNAVNALKDVRFGGSASNIADRSSRRDDTIRAIEEAIERLNAGEMTRRMVSQAIELNTGYTGSFAPKVKEALDEASQHLERASAFLRGK